MDVRQISLFVVFLLLTGGYHGRIGIGDANGDDPMAAVKKFCMTYMQLCMKTSVNHWICRDAYILCLMRGVTCSVMEVNHDTNRYKECWQETLRKNRYCAVAR